MPTQWRIRGDYIEACSCDYGCPCNYNGFPTKGVCEANVAFKINDGHYGDTSLDGLAVLEAVKWPGAIHEGNGTAALFIDERANDAQRDALVKILSGEAGGMPFELLASTIGEVKGPFFSRVSFEANGTKTRASADGAEAVLTPFTNPVTGEEHEVHTVIPGGFIWKDGSVAMSARNVSTVDGVEFDWTGQNAYYAAVDWSNVEDHHTATTKFEH